MGLDGGYIGSLDHAIANLHIGRQQGREQGFQEGYQQGVQEGVADYAAAEPLMQVGAGELVAIRAALSALTR